MAGWLWVRRRIGRLLLRVLSCPTVFVSASYCSIPLAWIFTTICLCFRTHIGRLLSRVFLYPCVSVFTTILVNPCIVYFYWSCLCVRARIGRTLYRILSCPIVFASAIILVYTSLEYFHGHVSLCPPPYWSSPASASSKHTFVLVDPFLHLEKPRSCIGRPMTLSLAIMPSTTVPHTVLSRLL